MLALPLSGLSYDVVFEYDACGNRVSQTVVQPVQQSPLKLPASDESVFLDIEPAATLEYLFSTSTLMLTLPESDNVIDGQLEIYHDQNGLARRVAVSHTLTEVNLSDSPSGYYTVLLNHNGTVSAWRLAR